MSREDIALLFLTWSNINYDKTKSTMKAQFNKMKFDNKSRKDYFNEDNFHQCIVQIHDKIINKGFKFKNNCVSYSAESFTTYLFIALRNELFLSTRHDNLFDSNHELENTLMYDQDAHDQEINEKIRENDIINEIYAYVDENYNFIESAIFKHYFKTGYSYRKLSQINGYGVSFIQKTIQEISTDVRRSFDFNLPGRKRDNDYGQDN